MWSRVHGGVKVRLNDPTPGVLLGKKTTTNNDCIMLCHSNAALRNRHELIVIETWLLQLSHPAAVSSTRRNEAYNSNTLLIPRDRIASCLCEQAAL